MKRISNIYEKDIYFKGFNKFLIIIAIFEFLNIATYIARYTLFFTIFCYMCIYRVVGQLFVTVPDFYIFHFV